MLENRKPGEGCKGCYYRKDLSGGGTKACHFSIIEDEIRGCPAGEWCIRYKPRKLPPIKRARPRRNCPSCGAPIGKWKRKCEYCGTEV